MLSWKDELMHYGVKGMRWGVRRYQNADGTLTSAGKKRYSPSLGAKHANKLANKLYNNAAKIEPRITNDVLKAFRASGSTPYGLEHRLKTKESLYRKILTDSKEKKSKC